MPLLLILVQLLAHCSPAACGFIVSSFDASTSLKRKSLLCISAFKDPEASGVNRRSLMIGTIGVSTSLLFPGMWNNEQALASSPARNVPTWKLDNNGVDFPILALNTVGLSSEETERAIGYAVQEGVRHVDFHPGKERDGVAAYLRKNPNANLFLNTKIRKPPPGTTVTEAIERVKTQIEDDFRTLGVKQVDMLMLRDSPDCDVMQAQWAVLEEALAAGKCRSLGVINYCEGSLSCLLEKAKVKPDINYFMQHVGMGNDPRGLRSYGESRGIRTFAYGAVGEPDPNSNLLESRTLANIGRAQSPIRKPEEVALRWVLQTGAAVSVRPTLAFGLGSGACFDDGSCQSGFQSRAAALDWSLTSNEMRQLSSMTSPDDNPTLFSSSGCPDAFVIPK